MYDNRRKPYGDAEIIYTVSVKSNGHITAIAMYISKL